MKTKSYTLCWNVKYRTCPAVTLSDNEVTIGEDQNTVKLTPQQWNILVKLIESGKLKKVKA